MALAVLASATATSAGASLAEAGGRPRDCPAGFRRQSVLRDFALGRTWVVWASCAHPERPPVAALLDDRHAVPRPAPGAATSAVQAGSRVRLWREDQVARVNLSAIALESGAPGATIRLRSTPGGPVLRGTVQASGWVQLDTVATGFTGRQP